MRKKRKGEPPKFISYAERKEMAKKIQEDRDKEDQEYDRMVEEREAEFNRMMAEHGYQEGETSDSRYDSSGAKTSGSATKE